MVQRTATSIALLTVLVAGIISPTGVCALMCERHSREKSQRHCGQPSETMPGMGHDHSAMNHASAEAMSPVLASQSCRTNCVTAERLAVSRKIVFQVTSVQTDVVAFETTARFLAPDPTSSWFSDGTPPVPPSLYAAHFSILRI